jgi:hypothetical protein
MNGSKGAIAAVESSIAKDCFVPLSAFPELFFRVSYRESRRAWN